MKKWSLLAFFGLIYTTGSLAQPSGSFEPSEAHYLWPTDASHHLTSTFAETRTGHFHAALDIKTWGRRGYEIYATRDAVLSRIAVKATGYGKVLYLKHDDGSFSIYAHLMRFNDKLQQFADSLRFSENNRPHFDRIVEDQQIRIEQGDVIAYSGASGIGPPHLHFELRTPLQNPFNPLLTNLSVRDNIPPSITGISVEPLAPDAVIEGRKMIHTRRPQHRNGHYDFGTIEASGKIGLGIKVFDRSNGVPNPYAVHKLSMQVDGQPLFVSQADSFSYAQTNQMFIDRVYPLLRKYGQAYQRLFTADGNTLWFYKKNGAKNRLDLSPGLYTVSITAADFYGNTTGAELTLSIKNETSRIYKSRPKRFSPKRIPEINIDSWNWNQNWVTLPKKDYRELTAAIADPWRITTHNGNVIVDLKSLNNLFMNIPGIGPTVFRRVTPGSQSIISSIDNRALAIFPKQSFYDTVSVTLATQQFSPDSIRVTVGPEAYPLDKHFEFRINRNSMLTDTSKLAFYKYNKRYKYWYLMDTRFTDDHITVQSNTLGTFITRRDTTPPHVYRPRLYRRPDGQWLIYLDAYDNLSGIDYNRSSIVVNGRPGIAEYEPEDNRVVFYDPDFSPPSTMNIAATLYDRMGNKAEKSFQIGR